MNRNLLRSVAAILSGWLVTVVGYIVTMVIIALFNPETFKTSAHYSLGYWLVTLFVGLIYSIVGGFITGIVARRREVAHAIGLVVFGLLISECWPRGDQNTTSVPDWYSIVAYVLGPLFTVLGGWLRAKQDILVSRVPGCIVTTVDDLRLSAALTVDAFRFPIAVVVSVALFVIGLYGGLLAGGAALLAMRRFCGEEPEGDVAAALISLLLGVSLLLALPLSRYSYRKIMLRDHSLMKDRRQE
jgi:hypothetical protein